MTAEATCPRCGGRVAALQEYCLECGLRLPGRSRLGPLPTETRDLRLRVAALACIAVAGAGVAIAAVDTDDGPEPILTATGGSVTDARRATAHASPSGRAPRAAGRSSSSRSRRRRAATQAVAVAQQARVSGLRTVGVLDSSQFASLRPGYWMTFSGRYPSEAEATGLLRARASPSRAPACSASSREAASIRSLQRQRS